MQPSSAVSASRACPVCQAAGPKHLLHRQRFEGGLLGHGYDVVVCGICGAGFADGIPTQADLNRYYAERSKYSYDGAGGAESPFDLDRFRRTVEQVAPYLPGAGARILDIGCATGGLLAIFRARGFSNVMGVDPSPACAAAARSLHGLEVRAATLGQLAGWSERFDFVSMLGVLEHLRDVREAVRCALALVRPGGLFYAAVPDVAGLADARNAPFQQFSMEHVNFFSADSLARLLTVEGWGEVARWQEMVEWREGVDEPIVSGLFRQGAPVGTAPRDLVTEPALRRYVAVSQARDAAIGARIDELVQSGEPILVWGAGALTRRLLVDTALGRANIRLFVDSSPHLQGTELAGRRIVAPGAIAGREEAVLVASVAFEREIVQAIREKFRLPNRLLTLSGPAIR